MNDVNKYKMAVISGVEEEDGLIRFFGESDEIDPLRRKISPPAACGGDGPRV